MECTDSYFGPKDNEDDHIKFQERVALNHRDKKKFRLVMKKTSFVLTIIHFHKTFIITYTSIHTYSANRTQIYAYKHRPIQIYRMLSASVVPC